MPLPSDHRWIVVGELDMRHRANAPNDAPDYQIEDLIDAISSRIDQGKARRIYAKGNRVMWCSHVDGDNNFYRLLFQDGNKNVTGAAYLHFQQYTVREAEKEDDEGGLCTAHILIRRNANDQGRHLILIEKVPGISLSSIKTHLTWIFRDKQYQKRTQDDDGNEKSLRPDFKIEGYQSKTIRDALRDGVLQDVEFIGHEEEFPDGLDESGIVRRVDYEAKWDVRRQVTEDEARKIFGLIPGFSAKAHKDVDINQIFVRIKTSDGQIKRTEVDIEKGEILEQTFVQNELVDNFSQPLPTHYEVFHDDMIRKMIEVEKSVGG